MKTLIALACAGCGVDPGSDAPACTATFAGGFAETARSPTACPVFDGSTLGFAIDSRVLAAEAVIELELGAAMPGRFSSETLASWHAVEAKSIEDGSCVYSAGTEVVPTGSFTLVLDALDPAHGTLDVLQYVHAAPFTDCGPSQTETIHVTF